MVSIIGSRYDEQVIENAGKLFSRGMNMFNIFKHTNNMRVRKKAEAVERIIARLADNGVDEKFVRAAMEVYGVVRSIEYGYSYVHAIYAINNLPYDDDTKRLVAWELVKQGYLIESQNLRELTKLIGRSDKDLTDFVLANKLIPVRLLEVREDAIDYYVSIGLDREVLEAYVSANNT